MNSTIRARKLFPILWYAIGLLLVQSNAVLSNDAAASTPPAEWQPVPENGVISQPGRYRLQQDLRTDRDTGIKITANDVTLDLNGHAVRYTGTPKAGTYGIAASDRKNVAIINGALGGFWFNVHCTENERLRIRDIHFDDIPYIGINVADSKDVIISDNVFKNFRYDVPKDEKSHYVVGINIGARDAVITNNRFNAEVEPGTGKDVDIETVFVLFSADVTKNCVVTKNYMAASETLPRSYGIWIATDGQATVVDNDIRNMLYGICLAGDASAMVCYNRFEISRNSDASLQTIGISASSAKEIFDVNNIFVGVRTPASTPKNASDGKVSG